MNGEGPSFYDLLEVQKTASFEEIDRAYQRLCSSLSPDDLAMYSMLDEEETRDLKARLDEAHRTLMDSERRAAYDRAGQGTGDYPAVFVPDEQRSQASMSVGTVTTEPQMDVESIFREAEGPKGDTRETPNEAPRVAPSTISARPPVERGPSVAASTPSLPSRSPAPTLRSRIQAQAPVRRRLQPDPDIVVGADTEYGGALLRRLRESANASLQDVAEITKISKRYIASIEENDFEGLPAVVYLRGFVAEYARALGLDPQRVAQSYLNLYRRYKGEGG